MIDYELLIIKSMIDNPTKFANENDEINIKSVDYQKIYSWLKKYVPDMFDFKYIDDRVFVYQFIYQLGQAYECERNDLIEEQLNLLKKWFNY